MYSLTREYTRQLGYHLTKSLEIRSLQDVRVKRGADVASDHHLVTARLKLKLRRNDVDQERRKGRYNVDSLMDQNTAQEYKVTLSNIFKVLQEVYDEDEA